MKPDSAPPEAEVREIIEGEDVVVVFPVTDAPPAGQEADILYLGAVNEDAQVIIANSDGTTPGGITQ